MGGLQVGRVESLKARKEGAGPTDTANATLTRHMWQSVLKNLQPEVNMATLSRSCDRSHSVKLAVM